jgi:DNA helicase-2/ATP-dependent DNA helicase PcrA
MTSRPDPDALLRDLDIQQQAVCRHQQGPLCVLAGAGTGKTRAITHRLAYGVAAGVYRADQVMALTFTAKAAGEMRVRLRRLGVPGVQARTFHAAALAQLRHFWPDAVGVRQPHVLPGKLPVLQDAAARLHLEPGTDVLRDVAAEIEWRKVRDLTIDQYLRLQRPAPGGLAVDRVAELMSLYERVKDERREIDFEDILLATCGMLRTQPQVAAQVREQYRVFVVDEFQDVSPIQFQLLRTWLGRRQEVCVVGDPSQTVYSFAGADPRLLTGFAEQFPDAAVMHLTHDYRSTRQIVGVANRLIESQPGALRLETDAEGPEVEIAPFSDQQAEAAAVAARARQLIAGGTNPADIAVLVRVNAQTAPFERAFAAAGVPCAVRQAVPFFARPAVAKATVMLGAAAAEDATGTLVEQVERVLAECGWTPRPPAGPEERSTWSDLQALRDLAAEQRGGAALAGFYGELLERKNAAAPPPARAVALSTVHAAKGLEWEAVFLTGLCEGSLPISAADTPELIDEELRLMYVAVTRARRELYLSWPAAVGRSPRDPSRFLQRLRIGRRTRPAADGRRSPDGTRGRARR